MRTVYRIPENASLVEPIVYLKGDGDEVLAGVPPNQRSSTTPGYIQFRPYSTKGIPSAICPAVK